MNAGATLLFLVVTCALLAVPRGLMILPLLVGTCYLPAYIGVEIGSLNFTAVRLLLIVGLARIALRSESPFVTRSSLDRMIFLSATWLVAAGAFHENPAAVVVFRLGLSYEMLGLYVLVRASCTTADDVLKVSRLAVLALVPLAVAMGYEKLSAYNAFSILGGVGEAAHMRDGIVRAKGPFGHPILAGTVGAICVPMFAALWFKSRTLGLLGILASATIVLSSASSGPVLSTLAGVFALYMWRWRRHLHLLMWMALATYIALEFVMHDPAYYLVARIDLAGGSTSWYRARLIESAIEHLAEWWLVGTDNTRHWMWVVVTWSQDHTDITSHYIQLGVWAGLPMIGLFVWMLWKAFASVSDVVDRYRGTAMQDESFSIWSLGAALFVAAISGLSVSYFDQSVVFLYLLLAVIASAEASSRAFRPPSQSGAQNEHAALARPIAGSAPS